jgi:ABC-type transport system substrate-binding protein
MFSYPQAIDLPAISEAIAGMWEAIGITVTRMPGEKGTLDGLTASLGTKGLAWLKVTGLKGEPTSILTNYVSTSDVNNGFFDPAIDDGFSKMLVEPDVTKRYAIARGIIDALRKDYEAIPLFTFDLPFVAGPKVGSWTPIPGLDDMSGLYTVTPKQ